MNKTIKTIAIVFLILGALALIGGAVLGWAGKAGAISSVQPQNRQNPPQPAGEWGYRGLRDGIRVFSRQGFLALPIWLMGGGLTFLIAGSVLMIFNKKISSTVDSTPEKDEKKASTPKKSTNTKKTTSKKTASKS